MLIISATHNNINYPTNRYLYYTKREAIAMYKKKYSLTGKHNVLLTAYCS